MKTLHLIRHAKSSWKDIGLSDLERPLNARGKLACNTMAARISTLGDGEQGVFANVFVSAANRAQETIARIDAALVANPVNIQHPIANIVTSNIGANRGISWQVVDQLYTFDWQELMVWCQQLSDIESDATIVSHNPALEDLVKVLCEFAMTSVNSHWSTDSKNTDAPKGHTLSKLATCSYLKLTCDVDSWSQLSRGVARLDVFIKPKDFPQN